jgi:hypothetical protein
MGSGRARVSIHLPWYIIRELTITTIDRGQSSYLPVTNDDLHEIWGYDSVIFDIYSLIVSKQAKDDGQTDNSLERRNLVYRAGTYLFS